MKRVVFISTEAAVRNSPEGIAARALIKGFADIGCDVQVLTTPHDFKMAGASKVHSIPSRVPYILDKAAKKLLGIEQLDFIGSARKALADLDLTDEDLIFIRSDPVTLHLLALHVNKTYDIKCVCSFGDIGFINPYYSGLKNVLRKRFYAAVERRIAEAGNIITHTNATAIELYRAAGMPMSRCVVLANPVAKPENDDADRGGESEQALLSRHSPESVACYHEVASATANSRYNLAFVGSFYGSRSPKRLFEFVARYRDDDVAVHLFGGVRNVLYSPNAGLVFRYLKRRDLHWIRSLAAEQGVQKLHIWPFMPMELVGSLLRSRFDALVNVDANFTPNPFLASKIVQYLTYGLPIINISNEGATVDLLREAGIDYFVGYHQMPEAESFEDVLRACMPRTKLVTYYCADAVARRLIKDVERLQNV